MYAMKMASKINFNYEEELTLIENVRKYPYLYDRNNMFYKIKDITSKLWIEMGKLLNRIGKKININILIYIYIMNIIFNLSKQINQIILVEYFHICIYNGMQVQ